jgi:hypothetical protein
MSKASAPNFGCRNEENLEFCAIDRSGCSSPLKIIGTPMPEAKNILIIIKRIMLIGCPVRRTASSSEKFKAQVEQAQAVVRVANPASFEHRSMLEFL